MQSWIQGQVRLARLWEVQEPSESEWEAYADLYIEHHPGCLSVEVLSPAGEQRWRARENRMNEGPQELPEGRRIREELLQHASTSREAIVSDAVTAADKNRIWMLAIPIYRQERLQGFLLGRFDVQRSFSAMLDDVKGLGFSIAVLQRGTEIYELPGNTDQYRHDWQQTADVTFPGVSWRLGVWSNPEVMANMRSEVPQLVLIAGTLLALLLTGFAQAHHELSLENKERQRAEEALRASQARFAGILEISAAAVISTDDQHRITIFNQAAETMFQYQAAEALGHPLDILIPPALREAHRQHVAQFARSDRKNMLMSARAPVKGMRKDGTEFPMAASISKLKLNGDTTFTVLCTDITEQVRAAAELRKAHAELESRVRERTADLEQANLALQREIAERKAAEEEVQQLSRRVMHVQDEERRHLARELHDGAAQDLVAVILNLRCLGRGGKNDGEQHARIEECVRLVEQCTNELRTIAYLLHPPFLEQLGLTRTLISYIDGFSKRSGIEVSVRIEPDLAQLGFDTELTLFRIVQEGLANIHRHSRSRTAAILLQRQGENIVLEVADQGKGMMPGSEFTGVGLAGIRERVQILKGQFNITTSATGTLLRAVLPNGADTTVRAAELVNFEI
jgi:PAS domain S-box-containing protein